MPQERLRPPVTADAALGRPPVPSVVARDVLERLLRGEARTKDEIQRLKIAACRRHGLVRIPSDPDLLAHARPEERAALVPLLRVKPTRSLSGVAVVTVQSSPAPCPHGTCTFCPGGPRFGTAQSYTGHEPAALRASQHAFDARGQTAGRLRALHATGHPVDKVDVVVQGGTFPARDVEYQRAFVLGVLDALNSYGEPDEKTATERTEPQSIPGSPRVSVLSVARSGREGTEHPRAERDDLRARLVAAQERNERAAARMIGLTLETKPDQAQAPHCDAMLELGATRVEVGVQALDDGILAAVNRGHTVADAVGSFRAVKDAGLKLCVHMMPGLPGSDARRDVDDFRRLFADEAFRPDMLKIYPTLVVPGTALHRQWERGEYEPLSDEDAARVVAEAKALVPPWCRIQRVDRDIPAPQIAAGVTKSNLRELALAELARTGRRCRCLRCREAGHAARRGGYRATEADYRLTRTEYRASGGRETFLAYEDAGRDTVAAYLRLREPSPAAWRPEAEGAWIVREVKVVGAEVAIGEQASGTDGMALQHAGLGTRLMAEAERVAREAGARRMLVTAGVGVRPWYARLGYARDGPYMAKAWGGGSAGDPV